VPTTESGWPVLEPGNPLIRTIHVPTEKTTHIDLPLRWGTPSILLPHLVMTLDDRVEDVDRVRDDWGYAYRAVRGYSTAWSDHAGAVAVDFNATEHPLGKVGTFDAEQRARIEHIINLPIYRAPNGRSVFYWGGDYHNRKDEMHFGLALTLEEGAEHVARSLLDGKRGALICAANPGLRAYVLS
jgi:hypothetical protein